MVANQKPETPSSSDEEAILARNTDNSKAKVDSQNVCQYKKGRCKNPRAVKRNGKPHTLCEFHRNKQIEYQRNFDKKTRETRQANKRKSQEVAMYNGQPVKGGASDHLPQKRLRADDSDKLMQHNHYGVPMESTPQPYGYHHQGAVLDQRAVPPYIQAGVVSAFGVLHPNMGMVPQQMVASMPHGMNYQQPLFVNNAAASAQGIFAYQPYFPGHRQVNGEVDDMTAVLHNASYQVEMPRHYQAYNNVPSAQQYPPQPAPQYIEAPQRDARDADNSNPSPYQYHQRPCSDPNNFRLPKLPQLQHA